MTQLTREFSSKLDNDVSLGGIGSTRLYDTRFDLSDVTFGFNCSSTKIVPDRHKQAEE